MKNLILIFCLVSGNFAWSGDLIPRYGDLVVPTGNVYKGSLPFRSSPPSGIINKPGEPLGWFVDPGTSYIVVDVHVAQRLFELDVWLLLMDAREWSALAEHYGVDHPSQLGLLEILPFAEGWVFAGVKSQDGHEFSQEARFRSNFQKVYQDLHGVTLSF